MKLIRTGKNRERGFSLLEYCAGAAVIMLTIWVALNAMGQSVRGLLESIGNWATVRAGEIEQGAGQGQNP